MCDEITTDVVVTIAGLRIRAPILGGGDDEEVVVMIIMIIMIDVTVQTPSARAMQGPKVMRRREKWR